MQQCQQHLFCAFCVIANLWRSESTSIFGTNDIMYLCIMMLPIIPWGLRAMRMRMNLAMHKLYLLHFQQSIKKRAG